jgi:hypothetical protein
MMTCKGSGTLLEIFIIKFCQVHKHQHCDFWKKKTSLVMNDQMGFPKLLHCHWTVDRGWAWGTTLHLKATMNQDTCSKRRDEKSEESFAFIKVQNVDPLPLKFLIRGVSIQRSRQKQNEERLRQKQR